MYLGSVSVLKIVPYSQAYATSQAAAVAASRDPAGLSWRPFCVNHSISPPRLLPEAMSPRLTRTNDIFLLFCSPNKWFIMVSLIIITERERLQMYSQPEYETIQGPSECQHKTASKSRTCLQLAMVTRLPSRQGRIETRHGTTHSQMRNETPSTSIKSHQETLNLVLTAHKETSPAPQSSWSSRTAEGVLTFWPWLQGPSFHL